MRQSGWKVLVAAAALATGCSSSGRVVVQDGYRGAAPPPAVRLGASRPGALTLAPELETGAAPAEPRAIAR